MSGIVGLGEKVPFIEIKSNDEKPMKSVSFNTRSNVIEHGINLEESVNSVLRERSRREGQETPEMLARNKIINEIFDHLSSEYPNAEKLRLNLEMGLSRYNQGNHTFHVGNHLVLISKGSSEESVTIAITDVSKKSFARGGFGKVYSAKILGSNEEHTIALKLSRKKGDKADRQHVIIKPTPKGIKARESIEYELQIINYIRKTTNNYVGLNVDVYDKVSFNHQLGYFLKRYNCDGIGFLQNPHPPAVKYEYMIQVLNGLKTLRELNCAHRDIKPENILVRPNGKQIKGTQFPSHDVVLSDFGNAIPFAHIFFKNPYPSLYGVLGNVTPCYTSKKYVNEIINCIDELERYRQEDKEYKIIVDEIIEIVTKNDEFSLAVSLYVLWTENPLPFSSFTKNENFAFDVGSTKAEKLKKIKHMSQGLLSVSQHFSAAKFNNEMRLVSAIMDPIIDGLDTEDLCDY